MPYSRQRPLLAPTERITVRLKTDQRDRFIQATGTPKNLAHELHRAPVRAGKLSLRVTRESLEALIAVAAQSPAADRREDRALATLLRYLESLEDRFADPNDPADAAAGPPEDNPA